MGRITWSLSHFREYVSQMTSYWRFWTSWPLCEVCELGALCTHRQTITRIPLL